MSPIPTPRTAPSHGHKLKIPNPPKTLTPKRKHRKMLKDGSSEVWPEDVEHIFVEGLRQYWQSPYATFTSGRSRWRNAYLVEYLQKAGIARTKKQVASHIQVLRNMWKGEPGECPSDADAAAADASVRVPVPPLALHSSRRRRLTFPPGGCAEYALVAGADDEQSSTTTTKPTSPTTDDEDSDNGTAASAPSPITPSSLNSFEDPFAAATAHIHGHTGQLKPTGASTLRIVTTSPVSVKTEDIVPDLMSAPFPHSIPGQYAVPRSFSSAPVAPSPLSTSPGVILAPDMAFGAPYTPLSPPTDPTGSAFSHMDITQSYPRHRSSPAHSGPVQTPAPPSPHQPTNRLVGFTVWADRAPLCSLAPETILDSVRGAIRATLQLPGQMAVTPAISLSAPWTQAICNTSVVSNGQILRQERSALQLPTSVPAGSPFTACLPNPLVPGGGQWLDYGPITVTYRLDVDGISIALVDIYITKTSSTPAGQVYAFRGFTADGTLRWSPAPMPPPALPAVGADPHASPAVGSHAGTGVHTAPRVACAPTPTPGPCAFDGGYHSPISAIPGPTSAFGPYC